MGGSLRCSGNADGGPLVRPRVFFTPTRATGAAAAGGGRDEEGGGEGGREEGGGAGGESSTILTVGRVDSFGFLSLLCWTWSRTVCSRRSLSRSWCAHCVALCLRASTVRGQNAWLFIDLRCTGRVGWNTARWHTILHLRSRDAQPGPLLRRRPEP